MGAADVVREAAAAALHSGHPETAVEWLEQGRSIVLGQLLSAPQLLLKSCQLFTLDHSRRLQELSATLEHAGVNREKIMSSPLEQPQSTVHHTTGSLEQEADTPYARD
ncbi:hypothetical protein J3R82DRAFT_6504 [Butyriboletus roseoflavus]|nr:hypothetical protein J3R82DRAFT_6504 [Butyriboletus roseoflavus]